MKKIILLTTLLLALNTIVYSIPAYPYPVVVTQPDGTQITIRLHGDEHFNYITSEDGFLIKKAEDGFFKFATIDRDGVITPSSFICRPIEQRTDSEKLYIQTVASKDNFQELIPKVWQSNISRRLSPVRSNSPKKMGGYVGGSKYLVILVGYSDLAFSHTREDFDKLLNEKGFNKNGAIGSASDYFSYSSDSQFVPEFDVKGPYTLSRPMKYYGEDSYSGDDKNILDMVSEACQMAVNDGVDLSQYDTNSDSYVDNICIFYAGYSTAEGGSSDAVWPHYWQFYTNQPTVGTKKLRDYIVMSELRGYSGSQMTGIGAFCHEFSHFLGLPDFYKTDRTGGSTLYNWDIMDGGCYNGPGNRGDVPCGYSSYERFFMDWLKPTLLADNGSYTVKPLGNQSSEAFILPQTSNATHNLNGRNPNPANFYMIENRKQSSFDYYLPAEGMLIWRVLYNENKWESNTPNNQTPYGMYIMAADQQLSQYNLSKDTYPQDGVTKLTLTSSTDSDWSKLISDITRDGDNVKFSFSDVIDNKFVIKIGSNNWLVESSADNGNYNAVVYNAAGQYILSKTFAKSIELSTESLEKGVYFVVVEDLNESLSSKQRFTSLPVLK